MSDEQEITPDGYRIVPKRRVFDAPVEKGIQCGECGMQFDHNKAYGYACMNSNCPLKSTSVTL